MPYQSLLCHTVSPQHQGMNLISRQGGRGVGMWVGVGKGALCLDASLSAVSILFRALFFFLTALRLS
jgi:hypothetical protein